MTPAIRIAIQLVATKQGRSTLGKIILAVFSVILIPIILIGGASTSFLGYLSNDEDVFAQAKNDVREEMKIPNDMDTIFIRYLYLDSENVPEKQELIWTVKILFVKRFDDPEILKKIQVVEESMKDATGEGLEFLSLALKELRLWSDQTAWYEFKSREEILLLFDDPDSDLTEEQIEELKLFLSMIDEVNTVEMNQKLFTSPSPLKTA